MAVRGKREEGGGKSDSSAESTPRRATKRASATPSKPARRPVRDAREARATQRTARQSPYKMRLVIDEVRGKSVNDALAYLAFSKKHAAKQIEKVIRSAVANAEDAARRANESIDVDELYVKWAVINEGPKLKRFTPAAMGRATPVLKRTSHVEIIVAEDTRTRGGK
jgi:large subunit ribosomal protein L22